MSVHYNIDPGLVTAIDDMCRVYGSSAVRNALATFEATFLDPMPTIIPDPPELDAAELRRWAVEQGVKSGIGYDGDVIRWADKIIAYVTRTQAP